MVDDQQVDPLLARLQLEPELILYSIQNCPVHIVRSLHALLGDQDFVVDVAGDAGFVDQAGDRRKPPVNLTKSPIDSLVALLRTSFLPVPP